MKQEKQKNFKSGFTLLELLVVVLIIGILAAIALPQYKKVIERSKMAEAVSTLRAIASSQQRYYLIYGKYASCEDLNALDIELSGDNCTYSNICPCKQTSSFKYMSSPALHVEYIAFAQRTPLFKYYIYVNKQNTIRCNYEGTFNYRPTQIQKNLCDKLNETGTL